MNKKIWGIFLAVASISAAISGCSKNALSDSKKSTIPEISGTTESIETSTPTQTTVDDTTEPQTETQSAFDFVKTVESTYICGHQLSYPITLGKLGDDFTIDAEGASTVSGIQKIACTLNYKGIRVGYVIFNGCESVDDITKNTIIQTVTIHNDDLEESFETLKIIVNSIKLNDNHNLLREALGINFRMGVNENQIIYQDDNGMFIFTFGNDDNIISIMINSAI